MIPNPEPVGSSCDTKQMVTIFRVVHGCSVSWNIQSMRSGWKAGWHTSSPYILPAMYHHLLIIYIYTYYHNRLQWWNNIHELSIYISWLLLSCNMLQVPHPHPQCSIEYLPDPGKCLYNCVYTYIHTVIYIYINMSLDYIYSNKTNCIT